MYESSKWTTEGGDIGDLRNMLQLHSDSINLTMQALQSRSAARIASTIVPVAMHIADVHDGVQGDLSEKIDDLHRIITAVTLLPTDGEQNINVTGSADPAPTRGPPSQTGRSIESLHSRAPSSCYSLPLRTASQDLSETAIADARLMDREDSAYYSMGPSKSTRAGRWMDLGFTSGSRSDQRASFGDEYEGHAYWNDSLSGSTNFANTTSPSSTFGSPARTRESSIARRESSTLPTMLKAIDDAIDETDDAVTGSSRELYHTRPSRPARARVHKNGSLHSSNGQSRLPPPTISPDSSDADQSPPMPSSYFRSASRTRNTRNNSRPSGQSPNTTLVGDFEGEAGDLVDTPPASDRVVFEKALFRNAAILCDVRAKLVEYAQHVPNEPDPRYNTEMVAACQECRIYVVRKRENRAHGGTKVITSIWSLSDDGEIRLQQKLPEVNEVVPYCSYFQAEKVSLPPAEGLTSLCFHDTQWGAMLLHEKQTNWINYVFNTEDDAAAFQSAIFGRVLIGTYRTTKTTVIHEGLKGAFAFEEQFANIETLRLWEDDGVSTPGAAGGVLALMHISSNFGSGWARWWINSSLQQVRVKEDGAKFAKVKGIDITVVKPGPGAASVPKRTRASSSSTTSSAAAARDSLHRVESNLSTAPRPQGRRIPVKRVTGVRIEFRTEEEKARFVGMARKCQQRLIPLPDV